MSGDTQPGEQESLSKLIERLTAKATEIINDPTLNTSIANEKIDIEKLKEAKLKDLIAVEGDGGGTRCGTCFACLACGATPTPDVEFTCLATAAKCFA